MAQPFIFLGASAYRGAEEHQARQHAALATWKAWERCQPVQLNFVDEKYPLEIEGFCSRSVLRQDSGQICRRAGPRKPVIREILDALAEESEKTGAPWIGYANADIQFRPKVWTLLEECSEEVILISRTECEAGKPMEILTYGVDVLFFRVAWWKTHRHLFRDYLIGEGCWDVVYTSLALRHGRGRLWNREPLVWHERHAPIWHESPFAFYNWYLAALDSPAFSRWCDYHEALLEGRKRETSEAEELALQQYFFHRGVTFLQRGYHVLRCLRSYFRYRRWLGQGAI